MITVRPYRESDAERWDTIISQESLNGTILHQRRFLAYHGNRFRDRSLFLEKDEGEVIGLFPAAEDPADPKRIVSHPGVTYGGLIPTRNCRGEICIEALKAVARHFLNQEYKTLLYKSVPHIYHRQPFQDDLYALFRLDARRVRCDLSACIDLRHRGRISTRRQRCWKKAKAAGLTIGTGSQYGEGFWRVLAENLQNKHGVEPVHTLDEILELNRRFPEEIQFVVALKENEVIAGVVLFHSDRTTHVQYIGSNEAGQNLSALDLIFEHCIEQAGARDKRYFDFGISNENQGRTLNEGLYQFKVQFGAGSVVHEFYELTLGKTHVA